MPRGFKEDFSDFGWVSRACLYDLKRASERILRPVAHFGVDDSSSARPRRWELATPGQPSAVHSTNFLVFFPAFFKEVGENLEVDAKNLADFVRSAAQFLIS
ncbi:hypothetical protein Ae201684P_007530 [Aphanomyces euteiches]|nr:hypothetical protein Ae201684P_007530 [Aphanomyces euteiches]